MTSEQPPLAALNSLRQKLDVDFALQSAGLGIWALDPTTNTVSWDDQCRALFGLAKENILSYEQAMRYIHPSDVERVNQAVQWALNPASGGHYDQTYRTLGADDGQLRWVRFFGRSYFTPEGQVARFAGAAQEITQQVRAQLRLEASEARFTDLVSVTPAATAVFVSRDMRIQQVNEPMLAIWGKDRSVIGQTLHQALPELEGQPFLALLQRVFDTGQPYSEAEGVAQVIEKGQPKTVYFTHAYNPLYEPDGQIYGVINTATDVTAQVLARQQVEASEAKLNLLSNTVPSMIFYLDPQQRYLSYNQTFMDWFGVDATQAIGQTVRDMLGERAYEQVAPHLAVAYGGQSERYELLAPSRLGGERWLDLTYTPHHDAAGQLLGVIVLANDISEQIQARRALQASEARLQKALASKTVGVLFFNLKGQIQEANQTFSQLSGYSQQQLLGLSDWKQLTDAAYWAITAQSASNLAHQGETPPYEKQMVRPDGSCWWGLFAPTRLSGEGDESECMEFVIDITARKQAEQGLRESEAALQNAIELAELGTWHVDVSTGTTQLSERHAAMFGLAQTRLAYEQALALVHPEDRERVGAAFQAAMQPGSGGHYAAEYRILNARSGQQQYIRARGETSFDAQGVPLRIVGTTQDISLERESQRLLESQVQERTQALQLANQDLRRSNENLQQFAYIASHDLQEPLRKIQSFSSLLEQQLAEQLTQDTQTYLQRISLAGARMSTLIKDLLAYSRISTHQQVFGLVSLEAILDQVRSTLDWVIVERGAQIEADELPVVRGDESQLSQLFQNLLSNALKFTPVGQAPQIQIQCFGRDRHELPARVRPLSEATRFIQISVHDQGIGFDLKYVDRIFQVFQRLHGKQEFAGTGVGLAICQKVVENHGGAITADSKPGEGATFCVYLPA